MVKVISLSEKAYELLKRNKNRDISFSDIIISYFKDDNSKKKTEDIDDLRVWIKQHETGTKKKVKIDHDFIAYGVKR